MPAANNNTVKSWCVREAKYRVVGNHRAAAGDAAGAQRCRAKANACRAWARDAAYRADHAA